MEKIFYQKSSWEPPKACVEIENFIKSLQSKFDNWKPNRWIKDNLSREERKFFKELKDKDDIVYLWEDKGSSFTKMTKQQYDTAGENELNNNDFYQEVFADPSDETKRQNDILVQSMVRKGEISDKVGEYLVSGERKLSNYYHLLKTHNIPHDIDDPRQWLSEQGYPVRGIISGRGAPTERLAGFVDHFLQPGMKQLPTFSQDTKRTLQILEEFNEKIVSGVESLEGVAIVSLDVDKMYNNMTEELGMGACKDYLENRVSNGGGGSDDKEKVTVSSVLEALELCMKNNYFQFNGKIYHQTKGVGTGIKLAPPYACLGLGKFEDVVFNSQKDFLKMIKLWKRYIDDILVLFKGSREDFEEMVSWLNSIMPGVVKFKFNFSEEKIEFLDLVIKIEDGKIQTDLFIKPTNSQVYLDYETNHPHHCKKGIIYSQALRTIERCSDVCDQTLHMENLRGKFVDRNYPSELIDKQFGRAKVKDRNSLIFQSRKKTPSGQKCRLIFTYNQGNPPLHQWIREGKKLLVRNERAKTIGKDIQIAHKQPKNIRRVVAKNCIGSEAPSQPPPIDVGCFKCEKGCRVSCAVLKEGESFKSTNTGRGYKIQQRVTCDSSFVVYLATCRQCKGQYVGKSTTAFKKRHSNHKREIKNNIGGLGHHYGANGRGCGYQNFEVMIIEQVHVGDSKRLADRELYWQNQLRCYVDNVGNGHCYKKEF